MDERRGAGEGVLRAGRLGLGGGSRMEQKRGGSQGGVPAATGGEVEGKRDGSRKTRMLKHLWDLAVSGDWSSVVAVTWRQADFGGSRGS